MCDVAPVSASHLCLEILRSAFFNTAVMTNFVFLIFGFWFLVYKVVIGIVFPRKVSFAVSTLSVLTQLVLCFASKADSSSRRLFPTLL